MLALLVVGTALPSLPIVLASPSLAPAPAISYNVSGWITDSLSFAPAPGVTVSANTGPTTTTNATGYYALVVAKGTTTIALTAVGYHAATFTVNVNANLVNQNRTIRPYTFAVSGSVIDSDSGTGIAGAVVILMPLGLTNRTSSTGAYRILTENGTYTVTASAPGFGSAQVSVTVAGQGVSHYFVLDPATTPAASLPTATVVDIAVVLGIATGIVSYLIVALREGERLRRRPQSLAGIAANRFSEFGRRESPPATETYTSRRRRR